MKNKYKKIIQEILGTELENQGFTYMPNSSWSYERVKDQVWQSVSVVRERYCKGYIRMAFMTNAYGKRPKDWMILCQAGCRNIGITRRKRNCERLLSSLKTGHLLRD